MLPTNFTREVCGGRGTREGTGLILGGGWRVSSIFCWKSAPSSSRCRGLSRGLACLRSNSAGGENEGQKNVSRRRGHSAGRPLKCGGRISGRELPPHPQGWAEGTGQGLLGAPPAPSGAGAPPLLLGSRLTVDIGALMLLHLHQGEGRGDHGALAAASPVQDLPGLAVRQVRGQPFAEQGHAAGLQAQGHPPGAVVVPGVRGVAEFLGEGSAALDVAAVGAGFLGPVPDPLAQGLDGRAVDAPLGDAELPEVSPRVAGQGLAVLEVEAAELAAGFAGWGGAWGRG